MKYKHAQQPGSFVAPALQAALAAQVTPPEHPPARRVPVKLQVHHGITVPNRTLLQTFAVVPRHTGIGSDPGGFSLELGVYGVIVSEVDTRWCVLVPWSQVTFIEMG